MHFKYFNYVHGGYLSFMWSIFVFYFWSRPLYFPKMKMGCASRVNSNQIQYVTFNINLTFDKRAIFLWGRQNQEKKYRWDPRWIFLTYVQMYNVPPHIRLDLTLFKKNSQKKKSILNYPSHKFKVLDNRYKLIFFVKNTFNFTNIINYEMNLDKKDYDILNILW